MKTPGPTMLLWIMRCLLPSLEWEDAPKGRNGEARPLPAKLRNGQGGNARDLDDAVRLASKIPMAQLGSIEIRPLMRIEPGKEGTPVP